MRRLRRIAVTLILALTLVGGGLALVGTAGCDVAEDDFYRKDTEWDVGRQRNPNARFAWAYVCMVVFGGFLVWAVCKSSRRSVVKAGEEEH